MRTSDQSDRPAAASDRPAALPVRPKNIPAELKAADCWLGWRYVEEIDKDTGEIDWDKPPVNARTGGPGSSTNQKTWSPFAVALSAITSLRLDGIGFAVHVPPKDLERGRRDGTGEWVVTIDLDDCRDHTTGAIEPWARQIVAKINSYTEVSPSGCGLRIFLRGRLPAHGRKKGPYENYETGRYVTVTGQHLKGTPRSIESRQAELEAVHRGIFGEAPPPTSPGQSGATPTLDDTEIIRKASESKIGAKFRPLWSGVHNFSSPSEADLALCNYLAFWCGPNPERIDALFRQSGLFRSKWNREDYRKRTINKALAGRTEFYEPGRSMGPKAKHHGNGSHGDGAGQSPDTAAETAPPPWPDPIPLGADPDVPPFPVDALPGWLGDWVVAEAEATQTPPDLAALLALSICGAALAGKFRVQIRPGWTEPTNLFTVVALPPGDRKSAVHRDALAPVVEHERELIEAAAEDIAAAATEHRILEGRLKAAETKAAKASEAGALVTLTEDARQLAAELAKHEVPPAPKLFCDEITPEKLANLLSLHCGRMLQAAAEGTAFEIAKGRYSETANFDVYLKGHAGDPLRVDRMSRASDANDRPALSVALAVQPDVIRGLAEQATMRGRGFLARFLYGLPRSLVGSRKVAATPVKKTLASLYATGIKALWQLCGAVNDRRDAAHELCFGPDAEVLMRDFERWLEPQLADGEELSFLAGWAGKLAGAVARIAGILHAAQAIDNGIPWTQPIPATTVEAALRLGRDYFLPHAQVAFSIMGADERLETARQVWTTICQRMPSECSEHSESAPLTFTRRDAHQWNRRRFPGGVDELDPVLDLLERHNLVRPRQGTGQVGRGHRSPEYELNPAALALFWEEGGRSH
jgi:hypothetical protein